MMENRICVITGATSGIGRQTALQLAKKKYSIQIIGRNKEKCEAILKEVETIFPNGGHQFFVGDFENLGDVKMVTNLLLKNLPRIDVLINNAGCVYQEKKISEIGVEQTLHTNHLAPFLFTSRLMPLVKKGIEPRIVNVASDSHYRGKFNFEDLNYDKSRYFVMTAYERSKLANVLFTNYLAEKIKDMGILANSLHPGVVKTQIGQKNTGSFFGWAWRAMTAVMGISEEEGAKTSVFLASSADSKAVTGKYFDKSKEKRMSKLAADTTLSNKLWNWSEEVLGEQFDFS
ncbi:MAG: SDR family oxidoreductase [Bacteroidetes bacterium]|nr:SDR family oxidoreductase [Bacteroidota bacterium]